MFEKGLGVGKLEVRCRDLWVLHRRKKETRNIRTGSKFLEPLLDLRYNVPNMGWRPCPKYETVPGIDEPGLYTRVLKPLKDGIQIEPLKIRGKKILFLFGIAHNAVGRVPGLDLFLSICVSQPPDLKSRTRKGKSLSDPLGRKNACGSRIHIYRSHTHRIIVTCIYQCIIRIGECCGVNARQILE